MRTILFKRIVVLSLMLVTINAQFRNDVPSIRIKDAIVRNNGSSLSSIINSDRLSMNHSFSLGMASMWFWNELWNLLKQVKLYY